MSRPVAAIASLPMYDLPEVRAATDAVWTALRQRLGDAGIDGVPAQLKRNGDVERHWSSDRLLFSQTCGYPLTHAFEGRLQLVATPLYDVPGCDGPNYRSFIVVARSSAFRAPGDLRGACAAYNTADSMSGMLALKAVFAPLARDGRFFGRVVCSGGHARSAEMVAQGTADVAAIDCVTYALLHRHRPGLTDELRIIADGPVAPSLPYVTAVNRTPRQAEMIRRALVCVCKDATLKQAREQLFLAGVAVMGRTDYQRVLDIERQADSFGYHQLA